MKIKIIEGNNTFELNQKEYSDFVEWNTKQINEYMKKLKNRVEEWDKTFITKEKLASSLEKPRLITLEPHFFDTQEYWDFKDANEPTITQWILEQENNGKNKKT